jgi:hypothetical protein
VYNSTTGRWTATRLQVLGNLTDDFTIPPPELSLSNNTVAFDTTGQTVYITYTVDQDVKATISNNGIANSSYANVTLHQTNNTIQITAGTQEFSSANVVLTVTNTRTSNTASIDLSAAYGDAFSDPTSVSVLGTYRWTTGASNYKIFHKTSGDHLVVCINQNVNKPGITTFDVSDPSNITYVANTAVQGGAVNRLVVYQEQQNSTAFDRNNDILYYMQYNANYFGFAAAKINSDGSITEISGGYRLPPTSSYYLRGLLVHPDGNWVIECAQGISSTIKSTMSSIDVSNIITSGVNTLPVTDTAYFSHDYMDAGGKGKIAWSGDGNYVYALSPQYFDSNGTGNMGGGNRQGVLSIWPFDSSTGTFGTRADVSVPSTSVDWGAYGGTMVIIPDAQESYEQILISVFGQSQYLYWYRRPKNSTTISLASTVTLNTGNLSGVTKAQNHDFFHLAEGQVILQDYQEVDILDFGTFGVWDKHTTIDLSALGIATNYGIVWGDGKSGKWYSGDYTNGDIYVIGNS